MKHVSKERILREKMSGKYNCPHYVSPEIASEIANSVNITLVDNEAAKALAEIAENFAEEVLIALDGRTPTKENIRDTFSNLQLG